MTRHQFSFQCPKGSLTRREIGFGDVDGNPFDSDYIAAAPEPCLSPNQDDEWNTDCRCGQKIERFSAVNHLQSVSCSPS